MKTILLLLIAAPFILNAQSPDNKKAPDRTRDEALTLIESYRERVILGEPMSKLATMYSEDPGSAANGGQYDDIVRGVMVPEFEKAAFSLSKNEISEVFETQYGYHFIQLISRKNDTLSLRHILITFQKR
ncbi:MAG: peptidylprolyl isomerase [Bacteroidota bacterium]|nr:peptidylprolyl isomerase [Bacteroidota bacterium]